VPVWIPEPVEGVGGGFIDGAAGGDVAELAAGEMEVDAGGAGHWSQDNALRMAGLLDGAAARARLSAYWYSAVFF